MFEGKMEVSEFEGILSRNLYQPWRIVYTVMGAVKLGLHPDVATLEIMLPPEEIHENFKDTHNVGGDYLKSNWYNFNKRGLDENTLRLGRRSKMHGWRPLLTTMIKTRELRPSEEIKKILGAGAFDRAVANLGCY